MPVTVFNDRNYDEMDKQNMSTTTVQVVGRDILLEEIDR
jgi:hypothetical protein